MTQEIVFAFLGETSQIISLGGVKDEGNEDIEAFCPP